jgi:hypothetical protein
MFCCGDIIANEVWQLYLSGFNVSENVSVDPIQGFGWSVEDLCTMWFLYGKYKNNVCRAA